MANHFVIYVDFDSTLYDTPRFAADLRRLIADKANVSLEKVTADMPTFFSDPNLGGYDYEAHVQSYGLSSEEMWSALEILVTENNYLYEDSTTFMQALCADGYRPHILSFGEKRFQAIKIAPTITLLAGDTGQDIGFDVVMRKKREHILEHHEGQRGVLVDDKPDQDLPDGFTEITIDRSLDLVTPKQDGTIYLVSDLLQADDVIRGLI